MTIVHCDDEKCVYSKGGICQRLEITLLNYGPEGTVCDDCHWKPEATPVSKRLPELASEECSTQGWKER